MALSFATKALAIGTIIGLGGWYLRDKEAKAERRKRKVRVAKTTKSRDPACLFKIYDEDQTLGDIEPIWNDLHPDLRTPQVAETTIDIVPEQAKVAYDYMLHMIAKKGATLSDPEQRDTAIRSAVNLIAGACDWSQGLAPYTYESPFQKVWTGVGTLGELAQANLDRLATEES